MEEDDAIPSWIILGCIPRVSDDDTRLRDADADFLLEYDEPPNVTLLIVTPRISPDPVTTTHFPFVLATTSPRLLLLHANQGRRLNDVNLPGQAPLHLNRLVDGYFVNDFATGTTIRLPKPHHPMGNHRDLGIITAPGGGGYMVAGIPSFKGKKVTLIYFLSDTGEWNEQMLDCPLPDPDFPLPGRRPWGCNGVISHGGKLWWVDLSWGLLACDPFADMPILRFVRLPEPCVMLAPRGTDLQKYRCAGVSHGELRFVELYIPHPSVGMYHADGSERVEHRGAPMVRTLRLAVSEDGNPGIWMEEYNVSFADIWAHDSYKATGLPADGPVLALIHFNDPTVVYFFLDGRIFGVKLPERKVVFCEQYELAEPSNDVNVVSSCFVRAFELRQ